LLRCVDWQWATDVSRQAIRPISNGQRLIPLGLLTLEDGTDVPKRR